MKRLADKVALGTGGSRGIGKGIALRLAEEGAAVAFSYVSSSAKAEAVADELKAKGVRAEAIRSDQGNSADVSALVKEVAQAVWPAGYPGE